MHLLVAGQYRTDESRGICEDGDYGSIRYVNMERSRVFKMKSAKFLRAGSWAGYLRRKGPFPECRELAMRGRVHQAVVHVHPGLYVQYGAAYVDNNFKAMLSTATGARETSTPA